MARIAITDDFQNVAMTYADWSRLRAEHEIVVFNEPFANEDEAARKLGPFDIVGIMRERTAFPRSEMCRSS